MKATRKAVPGEKNYQRPGWFAVNDIVTYRCDNCFQHMSLYEYEISESGLVSPDIVCPNCKTVHVEVVLSGHNGKQKKAKEVKVK